MHGAQYGLSYYTNNPISLKYSILFLFTLYNIYTLYIYIIITL